MQRLCTPARCDTTSEPTAGNGCPGTPVKAIAKDDKTSKSWQRGIFCKSRFETRRNTDRCISRVSNRSVAKKEPLAAADDFVGICSRVADLSATRVEPWNTIYYCIPPLIMSGAGIFILQAPLKLLSEFHRTFCRNAAFAFLEIHKVFL